MYGPLWGSRSTNCALLGLEGVIPVLASWLKVAGFIANSDIIYCSRCPSSQTNLLFIGCGVWVCLVPRLGRAQIMVNGTDAKFLSKLQQLHGSNKHYIMPKRNNCPDPDTRNCFGVVHFAGDVFYNVRDFVEKNKVSLP